MTLTLGTGPLAERPGGEGNFRLQAPDGHVLYLEDVPWRVRAVLEDQTVLDSLRAKRLHETGNLPVYYFPLEDVRADALEESGHRSSDPHKGEAVYRSLRVGERVAENALWGYPSPVDTSPLPADYVTFDFGALDRWFEEDEEVLIRPRDPYHRVDVRQSSVEVRVLVDGEVVAETARPMLLSETGLPVRYYVPPEDVQDGMLSPSDTETRCPYKGIASYWSVEVEDETVEDLAWSYEQPLPETEKVAGYLCFLGERVEIEVGDRT